MTIRKLGTALPAALSGVCLVALLGCTGRDLHSVPVLTQLTPNQAPVGATVVITGSSFKDIQTVSFNGYAAGYFHVDSGTQISATVPGDACTGAVEVQNPAGLGDSSRDGGGPFVVVPAITSAQPQPFSGTAGTLLTLTGSGFFGTTGVAIGTEAAGQPGSSTFTYVDPNTVTVVVGANATTGPVVLYSSGLTATGPVFTIQ